MLRAAAFPGHKGQTRQRIEKPEVWRGQWDSESTNRRHTSAVGGEGGGGGAEQEGRLNSLGKVRSNVTTCPHLHAQPRAVQPAPRLFLPGAVKGHFLSALRVLPATTPIQCLWVTSVILPRHKLDGVMPSSKGGPHTPCPNAPGPHLSLLLQAPASSLCSDQAGLPGRVLASVCQE